MVLFNRRVDWRFALKEYGELSVKVAGIPLMPISLAKC
jgi:hypothetical protein